MNPKRGLRTAGTLLLTGAAIFQFGLGACADLTAFLNPCGTLLANCTAEELDTLRFSVPDFQNDPSCTIPGACGDFPFGSGPGPRPQGSPR